MVSEILSFGAPQAVKETAYGFLIGDPVLNNLVLTLLEARIALHQPGRYWIARSDGAVTGVGLQSPLDMALNLTAMAPGVAGELADAIAADGHELHAVSGEARVVARFAGQWAERRCVRVRPWSGQRIYEAQAVRPGPPVPGVLDRAGPDDRLQIRPWITAFYAELGGQSEDVATFVDRRVAAGEIVLWRDGSPKAMAASTAPLAGVARVQYVYTPPEHRRQGYAEALVRRLTTRLLGESLRPILFTDLENPTSNAIYKRIGYRAAAELVRYSLSADQKTGR